MPDMVQVRRQGGNIFAQEPQVSIGRSQFDRSHGLKTTFDASYLVPIYVDEVLPGDTFTMSLNGFARVFSPLEAPLMDNISIETFFFFVPNRLVWTNWQYFMGEHDAAGAQDTTYTIPKYDTGGTSDADGAAASVGQFLAYMGIPDGLQTGSVDVNVLPMRCYNLVYNEWFRDQNVKSEISQNDGNGPDTPSWYVLRKSAKRHDYFTSCLPYLQKGSAQSILGSQTEFDVETLAVQGNPVTVESGSGQRNLDSSGADVIIDSTNTGSALTVDISAFAFSINELRESVAIQRMLERDARGGTRYVELIKSHFGVTSPDYRLQRPEFLGGGKSWINVAPVAATTDAGNEEVGELRGVATGVVRGHGWAKSFTEHGYIVGLVRARGDVTYWQGLDRMWSRASREDFYIPALANLGEQSVLNKEIYVQNAAADDNTFGYQERWNEYRSKQSRLNGYFNPDATGALDHWHLGEDFSSLPSLNATFIEDQTPMSRVVTTTSAHDFVLDVWFNLKCARPMPLHSIPSLTSMRF